MHGLAYIRFAYGRQLCCVHSLCRVYTAHMCYVYCCCFAALPASVSPRTFCSGENGAGFTRNDWRVLTNAMKKVMLANNYHRNVLNGQSLQHHMVYMPEEPSLEHMHLRLIYLLAKGCAGNKAAATTEKMYFQFVKTTLFKVNDSFNFACTYCL